MNIIQKYSQLLSFYTLLLIPLTIPIDSKPLGLLIGIFGVFHLIHGISNRTFSIKKNKAFWLGLSFFALHLIAIFYSENKDRAWFDIEVKLSLLILPVLFAFKNELISKRKEAISVSFILGTFISGVIMLINAYEASKEIGTNAFYYTYITKIHPSYISMYFILSIIFQIKFILNKSRPLYLYIILGLSIIFHLKMVFLFQSKASILAIGGLLFIFSAIAIIKKNKTIVALLASLIVLSSIIHFSQNFTRMDAMVSSVKEITEKGKSTDTTTGARFSIWQITLSEIKKHPIMGVGNGDILPTLIERYKEQKFVTAEKRQFNTHSQYLETTLGLGLIGLISIISLLAYGLFQGIKNNDWMHISFILLVGFCFLPESMLNVRPGVIFFAFFYFLFFLLLDVKAKTEKSQNV